MSILEAFAAIKAQPGLVARPENAFKFAGVTFHGGLTQGVKPSASKQPEYTTDIHLHTSLIESGWNVGTFEEMFP